MKGIILAGGSGTRLHPLTIAQSKQLLPIFDKPLIYYPLSTLISFGIEEILIITNPENINSFKNLLGNGDDFGIKIEYLSQSRPNGIAEALIIGENFIDNDSTSLILGDNIFISDSLHFNASNHFKGDGAMIFSIEVNDPQRYGVVKFNREDPELIVEKPDKFISNHAVTGQYFYDSNASIYRQLLIYSHFQVMIHQLHQSSLDILKKCQFQKFLTLKHLKEKIVLYTFYTHQLKNMLFGLLNTI